MAEFTKQPASVAEQIELLKKRGLTIADETAAAEFLRRVSFYRLKGYLLHFEKKIASNAAHQLPAGTTFEKIAEIYELDRGLRFLFFEAIEKIEIAFRMALIDTYALQYKNAHWYLDGNHFTYGAPSPDGSTYHQRFIGRIRRDLGLEQSAGETRDQEPFIQHYFAAYAEPELPPCWMLAEVLSMGVWSTMYKNLASTEGAKSVAKPFVVPYQVLASWTHTLTVTRNLCAHHSRLWNRIFVFKPKVLPGYEAHFMSPHGIYAQAFAAAYLLRRIHPVTDWHIRFRTVALTYPAAERRNLLALPEWQADPFWSAQPLADPQPKKLG